MRWLELALLLIAASACTAARDDSGGVHVLRYATPYPPDHPFSRADKRWIEYVERESHGQLRVDAYWSGALISADQSLIELRHGVADVAAIQPIYARGGAHALRAQAAFYAGAGGVQQQVAVYKCLERHFPALSRELLGMRVLAVQGGNLPGVVTRTRAVLRADDLRGLRLRAPAELLDVLRALGADPVNMPMNEVYSALAKGVIDGVVAAPDALRSLHLAEVADYYAEVAIARGAYPARAIRDPALQRLPLELQRRVLESSAIWEAALAREVEQALQTGRSYAAERGMHFAPWSARDQRTFDAAYNASARAHARGLGALGIDGVSMFQAAQRWIAHLPAPAKPSPPLVELCPTG
jgi:TRAP-type C4-dicarboxylate transport system substrate-binding protein